jgi:small subunit ribosomal protein S11
MFSRQARLRIPALTSHGSRSSRRINYSTQSDDPSPPASESVPPTEEPEDVPPTWPTQPAPSPAHKFPPYNSIISPLLNLLPMYTDKSSQNRRSKSPDISAFQPTTEPSFYPQSKSIRIPQIQNAPPPPIPQLSPTILQARRPNYAIYINNSTRNTHVTITDQNRDPIIVMSAGILGLRHKQRATHEAGAATLHEALKRFSEKHPVATENVFIELVLKGFGPGRNGALATIFGPHGDVIRSKILRITDATTLTVGATKGPNKRRR